MGQPDQYDRGPSPLVAHGGRFHSSTLHLTVSPSEPRTGCLALWSSLCQSGLTSGLCSRSPAQAFCGLVWAPAHLSVQLSGLCVATTSHERTARRGLYLTCSYLKTVGNGLPTLIAEHRLPTSPFVGFSRASLPLGSQEALTARTCLQTADKREERCL